MMMVLRTVLMIAAAVAAITLPARAEDRSVLQDCKAMVARAEKEAGSASEAELTRCRQIILEWALRDARTTVDEHGRPLK